jgi:hypothetical protein
LLPRRARRCVVGEKPNTAKEDTTSVGPTVLPRRGDDSQRQGDRYGNQQGQDHQRQGRRNALCNRRRPLARARIVGRRSWNRLGRPTTVAANRGHVVLFCGGGNYARTRRLPGGAEGIRTFDLRSGAPAVTEPSLPRLNISAPARREECWGSFALGDASGSNQERERYGGPGF